MRTSLRQRSRGEEGQTYPVLLLLVFGLLAIGILLFQVGVASDLRSQAHTAADAAALAAANDLAAQIATRVGQPEGAGLAGIDDLEVRAAAEDYARRNEAHLVAGGYSRQGVDVTVKVETDRALSGTVKVLKGIRATATATARVMAGPGGFNVRLVD